MSLPAKRRVAVVPTPVGTRRASQADGFGLPSATSQLHGLVQQVRYTPGQGLPNYTSGANGQSHGNGHGNGDSTGSAKESVSSGYSDGSYGVAARRGGILPADLTPLISPNAFGVSTQVVSAPNSARRRRAQAHHMSGSNASVYDDNLVEELVNNSTKLKGISGSNASVYDDNLVEELVNDSTKLKGTSGFDASVYDDDLVEELVNDSTKLKGIVWPGMDLYDSASRG